MWKCEMNITLILKINLAHVYKADFSKQQTVMPIMQEWIEALTIYATLYFEKLIDHCKTSHNEQLNGFMPD
jgi:hypothetical protein